MPGGMWTILAGDGGKMKGMVGVSLAATMTTGGHWPGGDQKATKRAVIWCEAEDPEDTVLIPRFDAAGVDKDRVIMMTPEEFRKAPLAELIRDLDVGMIVFSPVNDFLEINDGNNEKDVRKALKGVADAIKGTSCVVLGICHLNKKSDLDAVKRILGSVAYANFVRSVLLVNDEDEEEETFRMVHGKYNTSKRGPDLLYTGEIVGDPRQQDLRVKWMASGDQADRGSFFATGADKKPPKETAAHWLFAYLCTHGPTLRKDVLVAALGAEHTTGAVVQAFNRSDALEFEQDGRETIWKVREDVSVCRSVVQSGQTDIMTDRQELSRGVLA